MIKVFGSCVGKEELGEVADSINNQWLGAGPKVKEFELRLKSKINASNFLMIDNASNGLYLALKLLNLPKDSEVIVPSFTWIACAHSIVMCGCKPIFCDVDYHTQNITVEMIEQYVTSKTKAIIVVHYAGLPVDMNPILEFGIPVIEDAAHAVNSKYDGKHCGTIGDFGVFSFDSMKNLAVGEGGGITCKKYTDFKRAEQLRLCGMGISAFDLSDKRNCRWWEQEATEVFIKMKPSDITAGIGLAQLEKLERLQYRRKIIWEIYKKELTGIGDLLLPLDTGNFKLIQHSYFTFLIKTNKRDQLANFLYDKGIYTTLRFFPIHLSKLYHTKQKLVNTEKLNETALNIPLHPSLSDIEIEKVLQEIRNFFN